MAKHQEPPDVRACLFDMDGLLIDSEDMYTICTNEVLREYGKPDLPWNIKAQLQGRPGPEAGRIFHEWAQLPITREEFVAKTVVLHRKYFPGTKPLPGVEVLLQNLANTTNPKIHIALATSSHKNNFVLKTTHLSKMFSVFAEENRVMGDDTRIQPGRGKPAPDIYLLALKTINDSLSKSGHQVIKPGECLVFEDSVPGVEAGRRAGMQVVWCPHPELLIEYKGQEKEVLAGLTGEHKETTGKRQVEENGQTVVEVPGELDDEWAILVETLEDFPHERYRMNVKT